MSARLEETPAAQHGTAHSQDDQPLVAPCAYRPSCGIVLVSSRLDDSPARKSTHVRLSHPDLRQRISLRTIHSPSLQLTSCRLQCARAAPAELSSYISCSTCQLPRFPLSPCAHHDAPVSALRHQSRLSLSPAQDLEAQLSLTDQATTGQAPLHPVLRSGEYPSRCVSGSPSSVGSDEMVMGARREAAELDAPSLLDEEADAILLC